MGPQRLDGLTNARAGLFARFNRAFQIPSQGFPEGTVCALPERGEFRVPLSDP